MVDVVGLHLPHTVQTHTNLIVGLDGQRLLGKNDVLHLFLHFVGELIALSAENLDAVVLIGVVRRGNDNAGIRLLLHRKKCHRRGGDGAKGHNAAAHSANACHERRLQHIG